MHARLPPKNVILEIPDMQRSTSIIVSAEEYSITYGHSHGPIDSRIPHLCPRGLHCGFLAGLCINPSSSLTRRVHALADGTRRMSEPSLGRHMFASGPQTRLLRFAPRMETMTFVPSGTWTADVSWPVVADRVGY